MNWSAIGAVVLAAAVGTGAFGAHGLRDRLDAYSLGIWDKAVFYHFVHAMGLIVVPLFSVTAVLPRQATSRVCWALLLGILLFSGSLYMLALSGELALGMITPVGGVAFIAAWVLLAWELGRSR